MRSVERALRREVVPERPTCRDKSTIGATAVEPVQQLSQRSNRALGGGSSSVINGGVNQPWRTASARTASAKRALRPALGGTSSATIWSRSVTNTVSLADARRTYSLSSFLSTFRPTARISKSSFQKATLCNFEAETWERFAATSSENLSRSPNRRSAPVAPTR